MSPEPSASKKESQLEALPVEIQIFLLHRLGSVQDLFSLIRASPVLLQAYLRSQDTVFTDVVRNQVPAKLLPIGITSLKLQDRMRYAVLDPTPRHAADIDYFTESFRMLVAGTVDCTDLSVDNARSLYQFHVLAEKLVQDTATYGYENLCAKLSPQSASIPKVQPSSTERFRILRAFYNLELMSPICRPYLNTLLYCGDEDDWRECLDYFVWSLMFQELSEMAFVLNHLKRRLHDFLDNVEDDRYHVFVARGPGHGRYEWEDDEEGMFYSNLLHPCWGIWIENALYSQSLVDVCRLLDASTAAERLERVQCFESFWDSSNIQSLVDLYRSESPGRPLSPSSSPDWATCHLDDTAQSTALGLRWSSRATSEMDDFVPLGLAIWDAQRLRSLDAFSVHPSSIACDVSTMVTMIRKRPSVEDRAKELEDQWEAAGLLWPQNDAQASPMTQLSTY